MFCFLVPKTYRIDRLTYLTGKSFCISKCASARQSVASGESIRFSGSTSSPLNAVCTKSPFFFHGNLKPLRMLRLASLICNWEVMWGNFRKNEIFRAMEPRVSFSFAFTHTPFFLLLKKRTMAICFAGFSFTTLSVPFG